MPTLAAVLKAEIRRLASREVKRAQRSLRRLQRTVKALRAAARAERRALARIERRLKRVKIRGAAGPASVRTPGRPGRKMTPDGIRKLRARLGMTRKTFSALLDVSPGSIFGWETGRTRPRGKSLARISEVRKMGVKAVRRQVGNGSPSRRRPARRGRRGRRA